MYHFVCREETPSPTAPENGYFMIKRTPTNIAIIAHIDHGNTTLIDSIQAAQVFRENARIEERSLTKTSSSGKGHHHPGQALHGE
jgi:hypothetical protein